MVWIELALRSSVIILIALGAEFLCRHQSAKLRHVLVLTPLAVLLLQPIQLWLGLEWRVPLLPSRAFPAELSIESSVTGLSAHSAAVSPVYPVADPASSNPEPFNFAAVYFAVLGVLLFWKLLSIRHLRRIVAASFELVATHPIAVETTNLARIQDVKREFRVFCSTELRVPCTVGIVRPIIVLPVSFWTWSPDRLQAVLSHELAHVGRRDMLWRLFSDLATIVYWFNPLVWLARRRCSFLMECACDEAVVDRRISLEDYAQELLRLARELNTCGALQPVLGMASSQIAARLHHLLRDGGIETPRAHALVGSAATLCILSLAVVACTPMRPRAPSHQENLALSLRTDFGNSIRGRYPAGGPDGLIRNHGPFSGAIPGTAMLAHLPCAAAQRTLGALETTDFLAERRSRFGAGETIHVRASLTPALGSDVDRVTFLSLDPAGNIVTDASSTQIRENGSHVVVIGLTPGASATRHPRGEWTTIACFRTPYGIVRAAEAVRYRVD